MSTKLKELELWQQYKEGDKPALGQLLRSMRPLIQSNLNKFDGVPIPKSALEVEARKLTINALDTYDPSKGAAMNTHVVNHLKHLQRYVLKYQNVGKIPEHRGIMIGRYNSVKSSLETELNREPSTMEMAEALGWSLQEAERMESELRQDLSLNTGKDDTSSFFDKDMYSTDKTKEAIMFLYYSTDPTTQKIMELSYGIGGYPIVYNVDEIAQRTGLATSKVRKIRQEIAEKINENLRYF